MARKKSDRDLLEQQITNAAALMSALGKTQVTTQAMVGVRNISDMTFGQPSWGGNPEIHLHAAYAENDPNCVTVIPYAWWRELRKSRWVAQGVIMRDDNILGPGDTRAPEDRPEDLPKEFQYNAIVDPREWLESRNEAQIRKDILKITSVNSLRRIRRVIDDRIREDAASMPDVYRDMTPASNGFIPVGGWDTRKIKALENLPALYRLADDLLTRRIEELVNLNYYA